MKQITNIRKAVCTMTNELKKDIPYLRHSGKRGDALNSL